MDRRFSTKTIFRKMIVYTSAALLLITVSALPASAAENTQTPSSTTEIPAQQESQPTSANSPAEDGNPANTDNVSAQDIQESALQLTADGAAVTPMQSTVYAASSKGLNVRSGPSTSYSKLGIFNYGAAITVTGVTADNWYQIQYNGNVGYVLAEYVSTTPLTTENPAPAAPAAETPPAEDPAASNTDVNTPDNEAVPNETAKTEDSEPQTEEDSFIGSTAVTSNLIGTPVIIVLGLAVVGVMALIGYSVYSLFKKDDTADEHYEDEYFEDGQYADGEYYEDEQYSDDEYYGNEQYSDNEYYEDEQYADNEYYSDEQDVDNEYYEDEQYSDSEYYEDEYYKYEQHANNKNHKGNRKKR